MMRSLGKFMQLAGLTILPVAMVMQITGGLRAPTGGVSVSVMLLMMVAGVAIFVLGRFVEGYSQ